MEALHRQALPFLLRRMKEDVLQDLPPKITQDYYCELSPLQEQLYEDFARSHAHQSLQETLAHGGQAGTIQGSTHIFQVIKHSLLTGDYPVFYNKTSYRIGFIHSVWLMKTRGVVAP